MRGVLEKVTARTVIETKGGKGFGLANLGPSPFLIKGRRELNGIWDKRSLYTIGY